MRTLPLLCALTCLAACEQRPPDTEPPTTVVREPPATPDVPLQDLVDAGLHRIGGVARPMVLDQLAPPLREEVERRPNRHVPDQRDVVRTLHYEGLSLTILEPGPVSSTFLVHLDVTDPRHRTADGLQVGMTVEELLAQRGEPDQRDGDVWRYEIGRAGHALDVHLDAHHVARLEWSFHVD